MSSYRCEMCNKYLGKGSRCSYIDSMWMCDECARIYDGSLKGYDLRLSRKEKEVNCGFCGMPLEESEAWLLLESGDPVCTHCLDKLELEDYAMPYPKEETPRRKRNKSTSVIDYDPNTITVKTTARALSTYYRQRECPVSKSPLVIRVNLQKLRSGNAKT